MQESFRQNTWLVMKVIRRRIGKYGDIYLILTAAETHFRGVLHAIARLLAAWIAVTRQNTCGRIGRSNGSRK